MEAVYGTFSLTSYVLTQTRLGDLPDGVDADRFPDGAEVVGGFVLEDPWEGRDPVPIGVARTDAEYPEAVDAFYDSLPDGWGLTTMGGNGWAHVCGPEPFPSVAFVEREAGGTYIVMGGPLPARPCEPEDEPVIISADPDVVTEPAVIVYDVAVDEPDEARESISGPEIPTLLQGDLLAPLVEPFGRQRGGEYTGSTTREVFSRVTVASAAEQVRSVFEADGWTRLGGYETGGTVVSVWSRTDERDRAVIATVTVRPAYRSAVVTVTATR